MSLLGEQYVEGSGTPIGGHSARSVALLGFLAVHSDAPQTRQRLAGLFWPESSDAQARTNLRRELHNLRLILDNDPSLVVEPTTLMWHDGPTCRVDVCVFHRERRLALAALAEGTDDDLLEHAAAAVDEYQGDLMPGVYDDWVLAPREALRRECIELCDRLVAGWQAKGGLARAIEFARMRVRIEPVEETGYRSLMRLQGELGDRAGAMSTFHQCAEVMERELGAEPSAATTELAQQLLGLGDRGRTAPGSLGTAHRTSAQDAGLVGRDQELRQASACWGRAAEGHPQLLVVNGDAGVGKSRLVAELGLKARAEGAVVATTRCFGMSGGLALAPVAEWLRDPRIHRAGADLDEPWRVEVARLVPEGPSGDRRDKPAPQPAAARAMVDAWRRHRFFEGLAQAVLAVDRPMILVLDDLQWCDAETTAWLAFLLRRAGDAPLLVATTARKHELAGNADVAQLLRSLRSAGALTEIELPPLDRVGVRQLGTSVLQRTLADEEVSLLVSATGGYPLYVLEALRSAGEPGETGTIVPHGRLSSVLQRRLEEVSPHAGEVAGLASAVGRDFTLDLLTEASDLDADTVVRSVDELWRHGILREQGLGYDFSHDLVREAAYASISPPHRWLMHRRLAQGLELLHADRPDDVAAQLADQYDRGGRPDRARHYYRRAAELAAAVYASSEAVRCFRRCLALVTEQPAGRTRDEEELDVLMAMAPPLNAIHGYSSPRLQETLERSAHLADKLARPRDLMSCYVGLFAVRFVQGHTRDSYDFATRAFALAEAAPEAAGQADMAVAGSLTSLGRLEEAVPHFQRAGELSRGSVSLIMGTLLEVHSLAWSSHAHWLLGAPERAAACAQQAVDLARSADHPYSLALALGYQATTAQLCSDRGPAAGAARELIALCERYSFGFYGGWGAVVEGWAGGGEDGVARMRQGVEKLRAAGQFARMPYWQYLIAEVLHQVGRPQAAQAVLDSALADAEQRDELWWLPELLRTRARQQADGLAVPTLRRAAAMADRQRSRTLLARCRRDLAERGADLDDGVPSPPG
ncbi:MAG TPA: AAA family ATPase [Nocardioides sp.]|uniref:ATP-binding protein n=1 Tax=Nocardioides sp. TaxID=35761 RepID=UPI002D80749A|nr:AAA family ATPase [Nocardioides sp.]HET6654301.1 AAA family ATPase [Nocardioides sp.]